MAASIGVSTTSGDVLSSRGLLFCRLFAIATVAHVVGNWSQPDLPRPLALINLVLALAGVWLSIRPARRLLLVCAGLVVTSVLLEMPVTGNHWVVAGLVAAAILATGARDDRVMPTGRLILLVFYSFAAFAKLNSGFFDPVASCAVFYTNQSLAGFGLGPIEPGSQFAILVIWATVLLELSIPVLLVWRRTRYFGVLIGSAFHILISYDLNQHFYDFTSVLLVLFVLFLPDRSIEAITELTQRLPARSRRLLGSLWVITAVLLAVIAVSPLSLTTASLVSRVPFVLWIPFSVGWLVVLIRSGARGAKLDWRPGLAGGLVVAVAFLNGLTPYTEVKTAYGFNMYANLRTAAGESNHFVVRRTFPLRAGYQNPIEIVRSSDPDLDAYRDLGYLVAEPEFRRYLANHPKVTATIRWAGEVIDLNPVSTSPVFSEADSWWWRFLPLRAIDIQSPPRCQDAFLAAL